METQNRRNILKILGLGGASVAVSTEAICAEGNANWTRFPHLDTASFERQLAIASALESLAGNIRTSVDREKTKQPGELVVAVSLSTKSELKLDDFLQHEVTIRVEIYGDEPRKTS